jgi:hypothetical protein
MVRPPSVKRAITLDEHQKILAGECNQEWRAYHDIVQCWINELVGRRSFPSLRIRGADTANDVLFHTSSAA